MLEHHPVFSKFELLPSRTISPEYHWVFLGQIIRKSYETGVVLALGLTPIEYPPNQLRIMGYPAVDNEYFEWIDVLEASVLAQNTFTMIELGAGYGRWLVRAALAVRQYHGNLPLKLVGVEAEPTHFRWMQEHLRDNGINPDDHLLIEAAVDEQDGEVLFCVGKPEESYAQAIAEASIAVSESVQRVKAVSLNHILAQVDEVDLIDADVQGAEFAVFRSAMDAMNRKVKRVHIGTHSSDIEQELRSLFRQHSWYKLNDFAQQATVSTEWGEITFDDGVQTWINPRLSPVQPSERELQHLQWMIAQLESCPQQLRKTTSELESQQAENVSLQTELSQLKTASNHLQTELLQLKTASNDLQTEHVSLQAEVARLRERITAMESSKFWQLRMAWIKLKKRLGLKAD